MSDSTYLSCAETAKILRKALKEEFPEQKFSVRSKTYSGGASITVRWQNGVSESEVKKVAEMFSGAGFDGMIDLKFYKTHYITKDGKVVSGNSSGTTGSRGSYSSYENTKPEGATEVHFGADFVFCEREITTEIYEDVAQSIAEAENKEFNGLDQQVEQGETWHTVVWRFLRDKDLTDYDGIEETACTCGSWPDDFFQMKTETEEEPELNEWEERQQAKAERYRELAEKHHQASHDRYESSNKAVAGIPFGQPILVGHHSEGAHRSALNRSWNHMDKSVEHENKAEYYERKAKGAENNKTISSDDPDAVKKLKAKLEKLEETRTKTKDYNKKARKEGKETLPSWHFQNLSGNIRRVKQRIKKLEEQQDMKDQEWSFGEITVKVNTDANRVQVLFPGVPSKETRDKLKRNGFRWSRYHMAWQRMINNYAIYLAKDIAGGING